MPEPANVKEDSSGRPAAIITAQRWETVESILDNWRIDDEWWRSEPVSRLYFSVILTTGKRLILYKDLLSGSWFQSNR